MCYICVQLYAYVTICYVGDIFFSEDTVFVHINHFKPLLQTQEHKFNLQYMDWRLRKGTLVHMDQQRARLACTSDTFAYDLRYSPTQ